MESANPRVGSEGSGRGSGAHGISFRTWCLAAGASCKEKAIGTMDGLGWGLRRQSFKAENGWMVSYAHTLEGLGTGSIIGLGVTRVESGFCAASCLDDVLTSGGVFGFCFVSVFLLPVSVCQAYEKPGWRCRVKVYCDERPYDA